MRELELVFDARMAAFPPRLPEQPIFYPVLDRAYAEQIARDWTAKTEPFAGYVAEFDLDDAYASQFEHHVVGARQHEELWVPAEELSEFNAHIQGPIRIVIAFFGNGFRGHIPERFGLAGHDADEQVRLLMKTRSYAPMDFYLETRANEVTVFLNFPYWAASSPEDLRVDSAEFATTLAALHDCWAIGERKAPLIEHGERVA
jgi:hypothetical protein